MKEGFLVLPSVSFSRLTFYCVLFVSLRQLNVAPPPPPF